MQISCGVASYDMLPLHVSIDSLHIKKSAARSHEHRHNVFHVVLYGEGHGNFSIGGKILDAEPGLLVLSSPGEGHMFQPIDKGKVSYSEFSFSYVCGKGNGLDISFKELLEAYSGMEITKWQNVLLLDKDQHKSLGNILARIAELKEDNSRFRFIQFHRNLSELFHFLIMTYAGLDTPIEDSISSRLGRARDYMHSHCTGRIRIEKLASEACISKGHFQREFKKKFGLAPVSYMNEYRISAAKNLLRTTPLSCAEIAAKAGFTDIFYFSKVFSRIAGKSPVEYRKG
ncbi:MAG: hypothetical protein A2X48_02325 [Lentisphaerae bacterium GWF2_49_21]|nr:MAG: hypothetical protein A2X48_02325 [Lentisphaerae bacterium GWF2_49_21]